MSNVLSSVALPVIVIAALAPAHVANLFARGAGLPLEGAQREGFLAGTAHEDRLPLSSTRSALWSVLFLHLGEREVASWLAALAPGTWQDRARLACTCSKPAPWKVSIWLVYIACRTDWHVDASRVGAPLDCLFEFRMTVYRWSQRMLRSTQLAPRQRAAEA